MVKVREYEMLVDNIRIAHGHHVNGSTYRDQQTNETDDSNKLHDGRDVRLLG